MRATSLLRWVCTSTAIICTTVGIPCTSHASCSEVSGYYLVSSGPLNAIYQYDIDGTPIGEFVMPELAGLLGPQHMTFDNDGHMYVAAYWTDRVLRYDALTGDFVDTFVEGAPIEQPAFVTWMDGRLIVSSLGAGRVLTFDADGSPYVDFVEAGHLTSPHAVVRDGLGHVLVADGPGNRIGRFDERTGAFIDYFHAGAPLNWPLGIALSPDGACIYVSNWTSGRIEEFRLSDALWIGTFIDDPGINNPDNLGYTHDGRLMVTCYGSNQIRTYDAATGALVDVLIDDVSGPNQALWVSTVGTSSPDLTNDGIVGPADLAQLLGAWGDCPLFPAPRKKIPAGPPCPADLNDDGDVGPADLASLLGSWGPCTTRTSDR